ncbi:cell division protein FtsQ/DivIB [Nocardioides sambongensis]|uniref:cell division protein FtsQ/DivIB n=1 Tax=Nocardioides sambongensis TaxID=2589074 RepID=UPI0038B2E24B
MERRIAGNLTTVESVDVARVWPHEVSILIQERTPVAVFDAGTGLQYVDATGARFGSLKRLPEDLPLIVGTADVDNLALNEAAAVVAALSPQVAGMVDRIEVATVDQIELRLRDGRVVRWGSAERSEDKAEVLLALMDQDAEVYDVSVPGRPTTR